MAENLQKLASVHIPIKTNTLMLDVTPGKPVIILGRNGTGKSALVHYIVSHINGQIIYLPGSRPSYFENESLSLTPASRRDLIQNMRSWDSSPDTRWRVPSGTSRNEKAIHNLQSVVTQFAVTAVEEIKREGRKSAAIARLQSGEAPLDRVNVLLAQANLPVRIRMEAGELRCQRADKIYSIAKMSDGERTALVIIAEIVAAASGSIFVIDEPELHIHRSIVVPLLAALMAEKPGCAFVISTHELELASSAPFAQILLVRGCQWDGGAAKFWDVDLLPVAGEIPESIRLDLLGSRRQILFIEGTSTSLDQPLYALLYPDVSVRSRESCREIVRAVTGLRSTEVLHHVEAYGLVDSDGMATEFVTKLEADGIYALPIFAVESLYYATEVLEKVAARQSATFGISIAALLGEAQAEALDSLKQDQVNHLASRISERQIRDQLLLALPDRQAIAGNGAGAINVSFTSPYPAELTRLGNLVKKGDLAAIIARYPVRESGVLNAISKKLHFQGRSDFERAALTCIGTDEALRVALRQKLAMLSTKLMKVPGQLSTGKHRGNRRLARER